MQGGAVAISPDEKRIAVGDQAGAVTLYDLAGNAIGDPKSFDGPINALGWASQRDWLAVGTTKGEIAVLDSGAEHMPVVAQQKFGADSVAALAWSPQELALAFVCDGKAVCLWRAKPDADPAQPFKPAERFEGHSLGVTRLSFAPSGARMASAAADGTIRIWSLKQDTDASYAFYADDPWNINTVAVSPDHQRVAGGSTDGAIGLWDARTGASGQIVRSAEDFEVRDLAWNRMGAVAALRENDTVTVISTAAGQPPIEIPIKTHTGYHLVWADEDRKIAVAMVENGVFLLDPLSPNSQPVSVGVGDGKDEAWGVASVPGNNSLLVSYIGGEIRIWDLTSKQPVGSLRDPQAKPGKRIGIGSMSISPDQRLLATSSGDGFVQVYDLARRNIWRRLETQSPIISRVAFSPDGQKLAALGSDNRLYIWLVTTNDATLYLAVNVISRRAAVGDGEHRNEHASWLDWISDDHIAIAVNSAAISVVGIDPKKWLKRIDGLALISENPIN